MKKLITMMAAAVLGSFAWSADFTTSLSYGATQLDNRGLGTTTIVGYTDAGDQKTTENNVYWWAKSYGVNYDQPGVITNDGSSVSAAKFIHLETDANDPVLRTFTRIEGEACTNEPIAIAQHGIFVDTTVQFTGTDTAPDTTISTNKLMVWLKVIEADDTVSPAIAGSTNLMVTCGAIVNENIVPTNYVLNTTAAIDPANWYRLTIRADQETVGVKTYSFFRIYLDGAEVTATDNPKFYSLQAGKNGDTALSYAGFEGTGNIKNVDLLTASDAPVFAKDPTYLTISWTEGVTGFTVGDLIVDVTGLDYSSTNLVVAAGATTVTPSYVQSPLYKLDEFVDVKNNLSLTTTEGVASITVVEFSASGASELKIKAVQDRVGAGLIVDGETVGDYPYVKDAIAALGKLEDWEKAKITVKQSETITSFGDWSELMGDVTLDLNGKTIAVDTANDWKGSVSDGDHFDKSCMIKNSAGATITITNSVADVGQMVGSVGVAIICNEVGTIYLTKANIKYEGAINSFHNDETFKGSMTIFGGKFKPQVSFQSGDTHNGLAADHEWVDRGEGWFEVCEKSAPTLYTITIASSITGGSVTTDPADECGAGTNVTVTATPDTGYSFKAVTVDGEEIVGTSFTMPAANVTVGATFTKQGFKVIIGGETQYFDTFAKAVEAAKDGETIYVLVSTMLGATDITKALTVSIDEGVTLTINNSSPLANNLKVIGAGNLATAETTALTVSATLDLSEFPYAQTKGCTGGFVLESTGVIKFSPGVKFADATAYAITSAAQDAQIVVQEGTYTKYTDAWSTTAAVAKIGDAKYTTLAAALAAAKTDETVVLLAAQNAPATLATGITLDITGATLTVPAETTFDLYGTLKCDAIGSTFVNSGSMVIEVGSAVYMGANKWFGTDAVFANVTDGTLTQTRLGPSLGNKYVISENGAATIVADSTLFGQFADQYWFTEGATVSVPNLESATFLAKAYTAVEHKHVAETTPGNKTYAITDDTFTVRFISGEGTLTTNDQQVAYGSKATEATPAAVTGKSFKTWNPVFDPEATVTAAAEYVAVYTANVYQITYSYQDSESKELEDVTNTNPTEYTFGVGVASFDPTKVSKDGYESATFSPTSIATDATGIQNITVTLTKSAPTTFKITWTDSENVVVSNGTAEVSGTSGDFETGTVLKFYATVGAITNVTVDTLKQDVANPFVYTVASAAATIVAKAGKFAPAPSSGTISCETREQAVNLAASITLHPEQYIQAPSGVTGDDEKTYAEMFRATAGDSGTTVTLELTVAATNTLTIAVNTAVTTSTTAADLVDATKGSAVVKNATAGMYYWIEGDDDVTAKTFGKAGAATQATSANKTNLSLTKPTGFTTKAFYKIAVDFKAPVKE